jgi:hypothetical protein
MSGYSTNFINQGIETNHFIFGTSLKLDWGWDSKKVEPHKVEYVWVEIKRGTL